MKVVGSGGKSGAPPWMLLRLALETGEHHGKADADRLALMASSTRNEYRRVLARTFGFERPVERAVAGVLGEASEIVRVHCHACHLRNDLLRLGMTAQRIDALPRCGPVIRTTADAFGWMFVLARHTIVAGLLRRAIGRRLGDDVKGATSYLDACSDGAGARFRAFGDLASAVAAKWSATTIIKAAHEAFRMQRVWYAAAPTDEESEVIAPRSMELASAAVDG